MKSSEFINEEFDPYKIHPLSKLSPDSNRRQELPPINGVAELALKIETHCSEMLGAYRKTAKVLYRGMHSNDDVVITGIRPDRKPVEMEGGRHELLHQAMLKLGLHATRKNSIFCTTRRRVAEDWGYSTYAIFVKDGWLGTYNAKITDNYAFGYASSIAYSSNDDADYCAQMLSEKIGPTEFNASTLPMVMKKYGYDLLITGDSYIGVDTRASLYDELLETLRIRRAPRNNT